MEDTGGDLKITFLSQREPPTYPMSFQMINPWRETTVGLEDSGIRQTHWK
jgi:hypothetical protein